jgi:hypothetical protein
MNYGMMINCSAKSAVELPSNIEDLFQYYDIQDAEIKVPWRSIYRKKEGSSSRRRHDSLYSETFTIQPSDKPIENKKDDKLLSLIKVNRSILQI